MVDRGTIEDFNDSMRAHLNIGADEQGQLKVGASSSDVTFFLFFITLTPRVE